VRVYLSSTAGEEVFDDVEALLFNIVDTGTPGSRQGIQRKGVLQPVLDWTTKVV
jgi:hypothetical protein